MARGPLLCCLSPPEYMGHWATRVPSRAIACQSSRVTVSQANPLVVADPRAEHARLAFAEPGQDGPQVPAKGLHGAGPLAAVLKAPGLPRLKEAVLGHVEAL